MNPFGDIRSDNVHHAYIVEGNPEQLFEHLCVFCEDTLETPVRANPDFSHVVIDRFSVTHARELREAQMKKTVADRKKIFVVSFNFITREAQNALLKVLEEPTAGTHIFILTPTRRMFLDTVLSRVIVLQGEARQADHISADDFLNMSYKDRLDTVAKLVKDIKDEKQSKAEAIVLVQDVEKKVRERVVGGAYDRRDVLEHIHKAEQYLHDTSSSVKMILEYVALAV